MSVRVGIIGGSGYSGEELIHILLRHPGVDLAFATSRHHAGEHLSSVFPRFSHQPKARNMRFIDAEIRAVLSALGSKPSKDTIIFLALPHGVAAEWAVPLIKNGIRVIDLSADFRIRNPETYREFYLHSHPAPALLKKAVYGLPEIKRKKIKEARLVASPGCYPTSILLPLIPLLKAGLIRSDRIIADSLSGISGAGRKAAEEWLFCECSESARAYGTPKHRHLSEIEQELSECAGDQVVIQFTPHLIPVNRGILTTLYTEPTSSAGDVNARIRDCYSKAYGKEPFIRLLPEPLLPDLKNVTHSNVIEISHRFDPRTGRILLFSAEDNLTRGASGQAVQSMNIICGFPETEGLI